MTKTYYKCRKCGTHHNNPLVDCDLLDDTQCGRKFSNRGFQGYIE